MVGCIGPGLLCFFRGDIGVVNGFFLFLPIVSLALLGLALFVFDLGGSWRGRVGKRRVECDWVDRGYYYATRGFLLGNRI